MTKHLLSVARRFVERKPVKLDELPEQGLRAPWHKTITDWRGFLLDKAAGWKRGPFNIPTDEATEFALCFFRCGDNPLRASWPLPGETPETSRERPVEEKQPTFGPN